MYDRTELVDSVIDTVRKNLFEGGLLVVAVLVRFSRQPASGFDCRGGDTVIDAVRVHGNVAIWHRR